MSRAAIRDLTFITKNWRLVVTGDPVFVELADSDDVMRTVAPVFDILARHISRDAKESKIVGFFNGLGCFIHLEWLPPERA